MTEVLVIGGSWKSPRCKTLEKAKLFSWEPCAFRLIACPEEHVFAATVHDMQNPYNGRKSVEVRTTAISYLGFRLVGVPT